MRVGNATSMGSAKKTQEKFQGIKKNQEFKKSRNQEIKKSRNQETKKLKKLKKSRNRKAR
jgi:hypothetical protein